ncbi:hypothetical protein P171DRAFT_440593 [Karstenula rhodostoma CBS 690.94]|uniref:Uncharacterized protein n=1 Tax=Karstenula rhodostoma CBS 690.94 TaxID=1392251 RepID=A0A9P4UDS8_9PLEO|nr:hypothetical protein P171DRAFT_440593 [Karstenula rhodostoma CBS 690.94]
MSDEEKKREKWQLTQIFVDAIKDLLYNYKEKGMDPRVGNADIVIGPKDVALLHKMNCTRHPAEAQIHISNLNNFEVTIWGTDCENASDRLRSSLMNILNFNVDVLKDAVCAWDRDKIELQPGSYDQADDTKHHFSIADRLNIATEPKTEGHTAMVVTFIADIPTLNVDIIREMSMSPPSEDVAASEEDAGGASDENAEETPKGTLKGNVGKALQMAIES